MIKPGTLAGGSRRPSHDWYLAQTAPWIPTPDDAPAHERVVHSPVPGAVQLLQV
ncbi:hypothetical protein BQ8420_19225 [Nocardiopsis sp. JB363]|nr:hypothetical protein BQ8420_19225 [Nocardiopsis sp. JB363]